MKKDRKSFDSVSRFALTVLVALVIFAIFANAFIMVSDTLKEANFPASGTIGMLFDYGANAGHPMKMTAQALSNIVAYIFMLAAIIIFVLSLRLVKHDKSVKAKCAILGLALKNDTLGGFKGIFLSLFFAFVLVSFVFLDGGGLATLADIPLYNVLTLICYGAIVINYIKLPGKAE